MRKPKLNLFCILTFTFCLLFSFPLLNAEALQYKGMALGLFSKDPNYSYLKDLKEMKEWGITDVLLVVSWYQHDVKAIQIIPRAYDGDDIMTISDAKLGEVIDQAHSLGMRVVLFPILRLEERTDKDWRGVIDPVDKEAWWRSYERFILHYAGVAASRKVDLYSVGSELLSREKETARWKDLIQKTRKIFSGKLLYSANWDHYQHPEFWADLDYIGITAYNEISKNKKPRLGELKKKWRAIRNELLAWRKKYPRQPLMFTEIGYPSIDGGAQYPWNYFLEGPVDLEEQALCYQAFIDTWKKSPELKGVYFWVWWGDGGPKDNSYTPRGKPAAKYIQKWYKS